MHLERFKKQDAEFKAKMGAYSKPSLSVQMSNLFFMHPTDYASHSLKDAPAEDEILVSGHIILDLPKPKSVEHFRVRITNSFDIMGSSEVYTSGKLFEKTMYLKEKLPAVLQGRNVFHFALAVPATAAVSQRSFYGRVQAKVEVKVRFSGRFGGEMTKLIGIRLVHTPALPGLTPEPFTMRSEQFSEDIGPWALQMESEALTVAGLINFQFLVLAAPQDFDIDYVSSHILQHFKLEDPSSSRPPYFPPPQQLPLFYLNELNKDEALGNPHRPSTVYTQPISRNKAQGPFAKLKAGQEDVAWRMLIRLPNDDTLRPSTCEYTETPIRVSHEIVITIRYRLSDGTTKEIKWKKPIFIASCCCSADTILLPAYSEVHTQQIDPALVDLLQSDNHESRHALCQCGVSMDQVIDRARACQLDTVYSTSEHEERRRRPAWANKLESVAAI